MRKEFWNEPAFDDFYEEIGERNGLNESLEVIEPDSYEGGLTSDNVHKLTEDLMNPMPPSDSDTQQ